MISSRFTFKTGTYINGATFQRKFDKVVNGIGATVAQSFTPQVQQAFTPPGSVVYPIAWKLSPKPKGARANMPGGRYSKQKAAFFATDGFGKGIPYRRTGKVVKAWHLVYSAGQSGGRLTLVNRVPYARFVYGGFQPGNSYQQRFHKNTGWSSAIAQRDRLFVSLRAEIERAFNESLQAFGFIDTGKKP